jgi:glycosyltransferase involved in cell wall biosynthesis
VSDRLDTSVLESPRRIVPSYKHPASYSPLFTPSVNGTRPEARGKFLQVGGARFYIRGVSYGTFAESAPGVPFPRREVVERDFAMMQAIGLNTIRLYDVPPKWLLDLAAEHGLRVILGIPWPQHLCLDRAGRLKVASTVHQIARGYGRHPATLMVCVGNEIPTQVVRWYGKRKTEDFIRDLWQAAHDAVPEIAVTYVNYPSTEYLDLPFLDVVGFNVYLHDEEDFRKYLAHLQIIAGDRPLFLGELGFDSVSHGRWQQARKLQTQLDVVFDYGLCGAVIFAWTDDWFRGGHQVTDWAFGIVDRDRKPKPAYHAVGTTLQEHSSRRGRNWPKISVVIAAYNAAGTLDACLASLSHIKYPDCEIIVVDDGSTDATGDIAAKYAAADGRFRAIHTPNGGLSFARNIGLRAANGEVVAYTDADCEVDPDWLHYIALTLIDKPVAGVGGPNLVPPDDSWVAQCVGQAPGGPTHILLSDEVAEHIPGCNMGFWKWALDEVGGFNPLYRQAGDDVDICWRLQACGYKLGFSPAAVVWHRRRHTVRGYLKQQVGYGYAEALLERIHPDKFNHLGQARWSGRIYGGPIVPPIIARPRIYQGVFGSAPFQSVYQPASSWLSFLYQAPEWYALLGVLALLSTISPWFLLALLGALALQIGQLVRVTADAEVNRRLSAVQRYRRRALIGAFHLLQPLARAWGRLRGGLGPFRLGGNSDTDQPIAPSAFVRRLFQRRSALAFWGEATQDKTVFLEKLLDRLQTSRCLTTPNTGWESWDLRIEYGLFVNATLLTAVEDHGNRKRLLRVGVQAAIPNWLVVGLLLLIAITAIGLRHLSLVGALPGVLTLAVLGSWVLWQRVQCVALLESAARQTAVEMKMWELD